MRLVAEASPLMQRKIELSDDKGVTDSSWIRQGDNIIVPRDSVWHKQRKVFDCDKNTDKKCKVRCERMDIIRFLILHVF